MAKNNTPKRGRPRKKKYVNTIAIEDIQLVRNPSLEDPDPDNPQYYPDSNLAPEYNPIGRSAFLSSVNRIFNTSASDSYRSKTRQIADVGQEFEWTKWTNELPFFRFPPGCEVQIVPPFLNGIIRFVVRKGTHSVSVYFDAYSMMASSAEPYWEIYPDIDNHNSRFNLGDEKEMMEAIMESLDRDNSSKKKKRSKKTSPAQNGLHERMMQLEM